MRLKLRFRDREAGHESFRVVREADAVDAAGGFEFACGYQRRLVKARDDFVVDRTLNLFIPH